MIYTLKHCPQFSVASIAFHLSTSLCQLTNLRFMVSYKLTYFNARGWAEPIRWIFKVANVKYEDVRIPIDAAWATSDLKKGLPWGQLPLLEITDSISTTPDKKSLAQSLAIARFVARRFGLVGDNEWESAKCDEIVCAIKDYTDKWKPMSIYLETDEGKRQQIKQSLMEIENPKFIGKLEEFVKTNETSSGFLVGGRVSWTDLYLVAIISQWDILFKVDLAKGYEGVENLVKTVTNIKEIKEWMEKRPQTVS